MYTPYLAIASMFRDSQKWHGHAINQVDRYFAQLDKQNISGDVFALTGDSIDDTEVALSKYSAAIFSLLKKDNTQGSSVRSTSDKFRIVNLSAVANVLLEEIYKKKKYDYILWLESDIIIKDNFLIEKLFDCFEVNKKCGMVAPRVFLETKDIFYDTWGFNGANKKIVQQKECAKFAHRYYEMDSIGTCGLFYCKHTKPWTFGTEGFRELSRQVKQEKYTIYADTSSVIYHPSAIGNIKSRWV